MSGEIGFLLGLPLALLAVPVVLGGAVAVGIAKAGAAAVGAAADYERKRRAERVEIYSSGIRDEILDYRKSVKSMMDAQRTLNKELSIKMEQDLQKSREDFSKLISKMDSGEEAFAEEVRMASENLMSLLREQQRNLQENYHVKVTNMLGEITTGSQKKFDDTMKQIESVYEDAAKKEAAMAKVALSYIEEVRDLIYALDTQFSGEKYVGNQLRLHGTDLKALEEKYNNGNYEACMVAAVSLMAKVRQDILTSDEKHHEYENWQKIAAMLIAENKAMMSSQRIFTKELYDQLLEEAEKRGEELGITEDDIGMDLSIYWGRTVEGKSVFEEMMSRLQQLENCVLEEDCKLSLEELQEISGKMSSEWRVQIVQNVQNAMERWNSALQREALALDIISHMEEQGYIYNDEFAYIRETENGESVKVSDDEKDAQLCMKFIDGYGDEILVRLYDSGDHKVRLQITDMAEEVDPEIDKSATRKRLEEEIHAIVEGEEYQGTVKGGCQKGTEHTVVTNKRNRRIRDLI